MRKIIVIFLLFFINAFNAYGQTPEVLMVQGGKLGSCPSKTVKQMVDGFMGSPSWEGFGTEDGNHYINISGDTTAESFPKVTLLLQFKLNKDKTFEYSALEFGGTAQTNEVAEGVLILMCNEGAGSSQVKQKVLTPQESEESSSLEEPDSPSALIMQEAEKYRDVVKTSCENLEKVSQCITMSSCIVASILEELKHDDRGKKFKKTLMGGLFSKGSFDKAVDELNKSADKDELLKNQVVKISTSCISQ
jgi:hypothetical protein